jgi:hypothetical protein
MEFGFRKMAKDVKNRTDGWMDGRMDGWMDGWMGRWVDGWTDGGVDGWGDGRMDGLRPSFGVLKKWASLTL